MDNFSLSIDVRWADVDANRHVRHSAYPDYAAHMRIRLLQAIDMDIETLAKHSLGPVLFREETIFHREAGLNETLSVNAKLQKVRQDGSRWTFVQEVFRADGKLSAVVTVDGDWIDLKKRKLCALPDQFLSSFVDIPRTEDFAFI